jgi:hypothetical protein
VSTFVLFVYLFVFSLRDCSCQSLWAAVVYHDDDDGGGGGDGGGLGGDGGVGDLFLVVMCVH